MKTQKKSSRKNFQYCKNKTTNLNEDEYDMAIINIKGGNKKTKRKNKGERKTGRRSKFTRKKARTSKRNKKKATFYYFFMNDCPYCNDFEKLGKKLNSKYNKSLLLKK